MNNSGKQLSLQWIVVVLVVILLGGMTFPGRLWDGFWHGTCDRARGHGICCAIGAGWV